MRIVRGRKVTDEESPPFFASLADTVVVDVGTGDGRFLYRYARAHPEVSCVGIDPVAEAMRETSRRAARKPAKGGARNLVFVVASIEQLPAGLTGIADEVFVNYPWGSLLAAFVTPVPGALAALASLAKPRARFHVLLNHTVFEDDAYMARLGLPPFDVAAAETRLAPTLAAVGITMTTCALRRGPADRPTSWERRLVAGSGRETLVIEGVGTVLTY